jgi:hypothetical protein
MELVNSNFNLMADSDLNDLRRRRKEEFDYKVEQCLEAMSKQDTGVLDLMFEPQVIIKVTDKVYEKMISQTSRTIN